ncbi:dihydropteroate synthase [Vibrio sp. SM6]|uniref:Dihydropteroate synthase n=1 Tax=Vibrio agarilyticus TaxID=2726741 RepID=A0A7X8YGN5_9VIBR|nr:dihydropteroate synthase [Vibrio agarilyticus]NLS12730.1 dihydropteroate synthase [Vibrio agarilyticus]
MKLITNNKTLDLTQPQIMGILNVTPDSFSDGGRYTSLDNALAQAEAMIASGATIIDVGGESTRPGAAEVPLDEELARTIPVIEALRSRFDVWISIDTSKAEVMRQAVAAGADLINDVRALAEPGALEVAAQSNVPICLMHMQGQPKTMQSAPCYQNIEDDVSAFLAERIAVCEAAGIARERLVLDPGFGFGKTLEHNYQLLAHLEKLHQFGLPLLVGMSRKSMVCNLLDVTPMQSVVGSVICATIAAQKGAQIIRVHDVAQTQQAMKILAALKQ